MKNPDSKKFRGFSLVEVALALGIVTFSLLTIFGLLAVGQKSDTDSVRRLGAAHSASQLFAQRRAIAASDTVPLINAILPAIKTEIPETLSGTVYVDENTEKQTGVANALYRLEYWITTAPIGQVATVRLRYSWPPGATDANAQHRHFEITSAILVK